MSSSQVRCARSRTVLVTTVRVALTKEVAEICGLKHSMACDGDAAVEAESRSSWCTARPPPQEARCG